MQLYSFKCEEHGIFDKEFKPSDIKKANCPQCGKEAIRKYSNTPVHFSGSGFYCNSPGAKKATIS